MKKAAVLVLTALLASALAYPAGRLGGGLSVPLTGTMPETVSFHILPASPEPPGAGGDVPIAVYSLSANSFRGTKLTIGPVLTDDFVLKDASGMAYPFEIAICGYDRDGRLSTISQSGESLAVVVSGTNQRGEVFARFPFFDDPAYGFVLEALDARARRDASRPAVLTSLLFFDMVMI